MTRLACLSIVFALLFWGCKKKHHPSDLAVPRLTGQVTLDGVPDEPAWQKAATIGPLRRFDGKADARQKTQAWMTWDDEYLYFAFRCQDRDVKSSYTKRDEPLYLQEVVEIFLDPDRDRQDYMEFEVSPRGVLFDATFSARRKGMNLNFNPSSKVAVNVDGSLNHPDPDKSWSVELAIPFAGMAGRGQTPPQVGDRWRMNIFRLDKSGSSGEATAWKPTAGDFHDLDAFGVIRFEQ